MSFIRHQSPTEVPSKKEIITNTFYQTLKKQRGKDIQKMLDKHPWLGPWFCGFETPKREKISFDLVLDHFKRALTSRYLKLINAIWANSDLQAWISTQPAFWTTETPPHRIQSIELINVFKRVLASQRDLIISAVLEKSPQLRFWLADQAISYNALISKFEDVLASHNNDAINIMWDKNPKLKEAIRTLNPHGLKAFIHKLIASKRNNFAMECIIWINNLDVIKEVLAEIKMARSRKGVLTDYTSHKISLLQDCINQLEDHHSHKRKCDDARPLPKRKKPRLENKEKSLENTADKVSWDMMVDPILLIEDLPDTDLPIPDIPSTSMPAPLLSPETAIDTYLEEYQNADELFLSSANKTTLFGFHYQAQREASRFTVSTVPTPSVNTDLSHGGEEAFLDPVGMLRYSHS